MSRTRDRWQDGRTAILAGQVKPLAPRRHPSPARVTVGAIVLLPLAIVALLALGRLLVGLAPVSVEIASDGQVLRVAADGTSRQIPIERPIVQVRPVAPIPFRREHQVDGSDSTNMLTFDPRYFLAFGSSPYYQFQALLREEWRYSVWRRLEVTDSEGRTVQRADRPPDDVALAIPSQFFLTVDLERPEIPRAIDLLDDANRPLTVEVNRNDKYVRVGPHRMRDQADLAAWYFSRDWAPALATLLDLLTRALALALGLVLAAGLLAALLPSVGALVARLPARWASRPGRRALPLALALGLGWFLAASWYVAVALFDRTPHILDAIGYLFQAKMYAAGMLTAPQPPLPEAFAIPFSVLHQGHWFVQYPPGTALLLALGLLAGLPWLVQPLLGAAAVVLIVLTARRQYGSGTALLVLGLLVTSPFLLLNASAFLSHVPALCFASVALYAGVRYAERPAICWAALTTTGLGSALLTREIVVVPYGVVIATIGLARGGPLRGRAIVLDALVAAAIFGASVGLYLGYNAAVTGDPFLLPRHLFNGADVLGFGPGIGFYGEHTVASGLVNVEQQLVSLGFYLAGWPFGFSLAVMLLPFLLRDRDPWDAMYLALMGVFVGIYVAEFYHGIAFGPRYLFEALPSFVILAARGLIVLARRVGGWLETVGVGSARWRARQASALIAMALLACNALYFLPRQAVLYADYSGLPGGGPTLDEVAIGRDLSGRVPRLADALVVTDEWWWYTMYLATLNCPRLDCPAIFALGADPQTRMALRQAFPGRAWYDVVLRDGELTVVPGAP